MSERMNGRDGAWEMELEITWYQWHDGYWEAWISDESGRPPRLVRDRAELERLLSHAYRSGDDCCEARSDSRTS